MSSKLSKRFAASRGTALVLAGMLVLGFGLTAMAQSEDDGSTTASKGRGARSSRSATVQRGIVLRTFPAIFTFAKGGTVTVTTAGQLPSLFTRRPGCLAPHDTATLTVR